VVAPAPNNFQKWVTSSNTFLSSFVRFGQLLNSSLSADISSSRNSWTSSGGNNMLEEILKDILN